MALSSPKQIGPGMVLDVRSDFPALLKPMNSRPLVFLDSAASAQKPMAVINAMRAVLEDGYANIHRGLYRISQDLTADFEAVRVKVAHFMGAESEKNVIFTRNATESINIVAQSYGKAHFKAGDEVILTEMEHHANIVPWQILRDQIGIIIKIVPLKTDGSLNWDVLPELLSENTVFVSFVHVSNALGTINPAKNIVEAVKSFNPAIRIMVDGSQAVVHMPVDVQDIGADFYVWTGHKLYGPTGIGVLYGKMDALEAMPPYQGGGDMIETVSFEKTTYKEPPYRFEAGTPAIVEVIGLGAAIDYVSAVGMDHIAAHESELLAYGNDALKQIEGLKIHSAAPNKAGVMSFNLEGAHPSDVGMILDQCGVAVRTGHHCAMPVMKALGVEATIRASLGVYSNKGDIDALVTGLKKAKEMLA